MHQCTTTDLQMKIQKILYSMCHAIRSEVVGAETTFDGMNPNQRKGQTCDVESV